MGRVRVKICGLTRIDDVRAAATLGADALGFNFYPPSPRYLDPTTAQALVAAVPPFVEAVGLFVNCPPAEVAPLVAALGLRSVQWHGDMPFDAAGFPCPFIPAFPVRDRDSLERIRRYLETCSTRPAAILVDAHVAGQYGGTGRTAPWEVLRDFDPGVPLILAGGLTPENVADAVRTVRPYAVDVASGVESAPGVKDVEKMRRFIETARLA